MMFKLLQIQHLPILLKQIRFSPIRIRLQIWIMKPAYFWRVKPINGCGEGVFSDPFSFTTIEFNCDNNVAEGLPLNISATGTPTITSKIPFYDDIALADINVNIELDHTYLADLVVKLISPCWNHCGFIIKFLW